MATKKRQARPRTIGEMLKNARMEKGENGKPQPITHAFEELGLGGRQTYYHWERDFATPSLDNAERLAEYTGEPLEDIVAAILDAHGISLRVNEDKTVGAQLTGSGRVRPRSTGSIPGLFKCRGKGRGGPGRVHGLLRLDIQSTMHKPGVTFAALT